MKKATQAFLMAAMIGLTGGNAFARGGSDDGVSGVRPPRDSAAGILSESVEHSIRLLYVMDAPTQVSRSMSAAAEYDAESKSCIVTLTSDSDTFTYRCSLFNDLSHGGTILKKEVRCSLTQ